MNEIDKERFEQIKEKNLFELMKKISEDILFNDYECSGDCRECLN